MSATIDLDTIRRRRAELADAREKLLVKLARLDNDIDELAVTERTIAKLIGVPSEGDTSSGSDGSRMPKPDNLPPMPTMILEVIQAQYRQGKRGLAPREIRDEIAKRFWPEVSNDAVGPIAWRMLKRGELEKTPDELYTLPKDKASAQDAEASKVTDEPASSSIESQSDLLNG